MDHKPVAPFLELLNQYKHKDGAVFADLIKQAQADELTAEQYRIFRANFVARTLFTLPEVLAATTQASLDLSRRRTAFGSATAFEEAGHGDPAKLHPQLMVNALNHHGKAAFALEPLNEHKMMAHIRLLDSVCQSIAMEKTAPQNWEMLKKNGISDIASLLSSTVRSAQALGLLDRAVTKTDATTLFTIQTKTIAALQQMGVTTETIHYGLEQLADMRNQTPGYLQGVAFAHEGLADDMMERVFRILYAGKDKYASPQEFTTHVNPYFSAHGDYMGMVQGKANAGDGIEAVHAQREVAKIEELSDEMKEAALQGAKAFAKRNAGVWEGLQSAINSVKNGPAQFTMTNKGSPHAL